MEVNAVIMLDVPHEVIIEVIFILFALLCGFMKLNAAHDRELLNAGFTVPAVELTVTTTTLRRSKGMMMLLEKH